MSRTVYSAIPAEMPYVSVSCSEGHAEPWLIATFRRDAEVEAQTGGQPFWAELSGYYQIPGHDRMTPITGHVTAWLDGETYVSQEQGVPERGSMDGPNARRRFKLECDRCKRLSQSRPLTVRAEKVAPIFDMLESKGIKEISLSALARRVANRS